MFRVLRLRHLWLRFQRGRFLQGLAWHGPTECVRLNLDPDLDGRLHLLNLIGIEDAGAIRISDSQLNGEGRDGLHPGRGRGVQTPVPRSEPIETLPRSLPAHLKQEHALLEADAIEWLEFAFRG